MNFSALKSVAYPARWTPPRYRFGQQVQYPGGTATITGMRYCVAYPGDELTPALMEWRYEIDGEMYVPAEAIEPVLMCA